MMARFRSPATAVVLAIVLLLAGALLAISRAGRTQGPPPLTVAASGLPAIDAEDIADALVKARAIRATHPDRAVVVTFPAGTIRLDTPIVVTAADQGTAASPLILRAAPGGTTLSGARPIAARPTTTVTIRLPPGAPLLPQYTYGGALPEPPIGLYQRDTRLRPASWPARGWHRGWSAVDTPAGLVLRPQGAALPPIGTPIVVEGFFGEDWAYEAIPARAVSDGLLLARRPAPTVKPTARLRVLGAGALVPGRYAPVAGGIRIAPWSNAPIEIAQTGTLLKLEKTAHVRIEGLAFEKTADTAVSIANSTDIAISGCSVAHTGALGITVDGDARVTIDRCRIDDTGTNAVRLSGGHRPALAPSLHLLTRSTLTRFARTLPIASGLQLWGIGARAIGNRIAGGPQAGVTLQGNDHEIRGNELGWLVCDTSDAGAIYMGRDWSERGILVADNYLHDIGSAAAGPLAYGVYLDDQASGALVRGNIFFRMPHGISLGGGRDTRIERNLFAVTRNSAVVFDARGTTWQKAFAQPGGLLLTSLAKFPYRDGIWRERYPTLATLAENRPGEPIGNSMTGNIYIQSQRVWGQTPGYTLAETGGRGVPPPQSDWTILNAADRDAAFATLARNAGLPADPAWREVPPSGVTACPD